MPKGELGRAEAPALSAEGRFLPAPSELQFFPLKVVGGRKAGKACGDGLF